MNDDALYVRWDDGHESTYAIRWLLERNFDADRGRDEYRRIKWTAESFATIFRSFNYEDVIKRCRETTVLDSIIITVNYTPRMEQRRDFDFEK